jgi:tetratricopeptide (TPR) repeat protein
MGKTSRRKEKPVKVEGIHQTSQEADAALNFPSQKLSSIIAIFTITLITFLIYFNTLSSPFYFDDEHNIIVNYKLRDLSSFWPLSGTRYVGVLSFAINYHFGKLDVFGYHLVNIVIHIINGLLVWWFVFLTFKTPLMERSNGISFFFAMFCALIFVAHPVQTQAVTYIVQRFTSLATLFYLLSLILYIKARLLTQVITNKSQNSTQKQRNIYIKAILYYLIAIFTTSLAMKTKEISFTLPFMIVLYELIFFSPQNTKHQTLNFKRLYLLIPFIITLVIIPLSLVGANKPLEGTIGDLREAAQETEEISRGVYFLTQFRVIVTYIRLLFLPIQQNLDYDYSLSYSLFDPHTFISFLFLLSIFVAALYLLKRSWKTNNGYGILASFGIFWFFITLSVESSIIPIRDIIFEHRLYLPSVGAIIAFSSAVFYILVHRKLKPTPLLTVCVLALIAGPLGIGAYQRNLVWKDEVTLWEDVVRKSPEKERGHTNLGLVYYKQGRLEEAAKEYITAIRLNPDYAEAHNNLGLVYYLQGRVEEAIQQYMTALKLTHGFAKAHNNLGVAYYKQGRLGEAIQEYTTALELRPDDPDPHNNLGNAYATQGRLEEAIKEYTTALNLKPNFPEAHHNLGIVYAIQGRLDEAIKKYMATLALKPDYAEAHYNLGNIYKTKGLKDEARREFEATLKLRPNDPKARQALESLTGNP